MAGKYGTPMGMEYLGPKKKRKTLWARAGAVTIRKADGTVEVKPPLARNAYVPRKKRTKG